LEAVLRQQGIRVVVLRSSIATDKREDWYDRQLKAGVEVVICHPKLVETGLDLLAFPTLYFYESMSFRQGCVTWRGLGCYFQSTAEVGEIEGHEWQCCG
jgi:hypothetical protein